MNARARLLIFFSILSIILITGCSKPTNGVTLFTQNEISAINSGSYEALYITMDVSDSLEEEGFATYRGLNTIKISNNMTALSELNNSLSAINLNKLQIVYLHLFSDVLWNASSSEASFDDELNRLDKLLASNSKTRFEVLLDYPQINVLCEKDIDTYISHLEALANVFYSHENTVIYYMGATEWLIANPSNYTDSDSLVPEMGLKVLLLNICDGVYKCDKNRFENELTNLKSLVNLYKSQPPKYQDFSDRYLVFIGDSIFAYDYGPTSLPSVIATLSNAPYANCSQGGASAANCETSNFTFNAMVDAFIAADKSGNIDNALNYAGKEYSSFYKGLNKYVEDLDLVKTKKLTFYINYGYNDYFLGVPIGSIEGEELNTFKSAYLTGLKKLKDNFPDSEIIVLEPGYIADLNEGTDIMADGGAKLTSYRESVLEVARALNLTVIKPYDALNLSLDNSYIYLADNTHPNQRGRFILGQAIVSP